MGTDRLAGLPDPVVEPVPPISVRSGTKYIGSACCSKMILANYNGIVVGACPDHSPIHISGHGEIIRYWGQPDG